MFTRLQSHFGLFGLTCSLILCKICVADPDVICRYFTTSLNTSISRYECQNNYDDCCFDDIAPFNEPICCHNSKLSNWWIGLVVCFGIVLVCFLIAALKLWSPLASKCKHKSSNAVRNQSELYIPHRPSSQSAHSAEAVRSNKSDLASDLPKYEELFFIKTISETGEMPPEYSKPT